MKEWKSWTARLLSWGFGFLLVWAALNKFIDPRAFARTVENYRLVGRGLSMLAAVWLPAFEAALGLLLIMGIWRREATLLNAGLMGFFLVLLVQAYARGLDIECGCFGAHSSSIGIFKLLENAGLAIAAGVLYGMESKRN